MFEKLNNIIIPEIKNYDEYINELYDEISKCI